MYQDSTTATTWKWQKGKLSKAKKSLIKTVKCLVSAYVTILPGKRATRGCIWDDIVVVVVVLQLIYLLTVCVLCVIKRTLKSSLEPRTKCKQLDFADIDVNESWAGTLGDGIEVWERNCYNQTLICLWKSLCFCIFLWMLWIWSISELSYDLTAFLSQFKFKKMSAWNAPPITKQPLNSIYSW